ncbi:hypothetical protein, partial [Nocardioides sp.]|uniref:hypothetical protein n=1 Tax=Nocardioides sp. TaxID=35761 RepID=UPI002735F490
AEITVRGLPTSAPVTVRGRLHGPFAKKDNTQCSAAKLYKQPAISFTGDGTKRTPVVTVKDAGFYVWQAVVFEGPLSMPAQSGCGQRFRVD